MIRLDLGHNKLFGEEKNKCVIVAETIWDRLLSSFELTADHGVRK